MRTATLRVQEGEMGAPRIWVALLGRVRALAASGEAALAYAEARALAERLVARGTAEEVADVEEVLADAGLLCPPLL